MMTTSTANQVTSSCWWALTNGGSLQMMCEQKGYSTMETAEGTMREQRTLVAQNVFIYPLLHGSVHISAWEKFCHEERICCPAKSSLYVRFCL